MRVGLHDPQCGRGHLNKDPDRLQGKTGQGHRLRVPRFRRKALRLPKGQDPRQHIKILRSQKLLTVRRPIKVRMPFLINTAIENWVAMGE